MKQHVISEVVAHDLCSGCGVCVGVCPSDILQMCMQPNGDLAPELVGNCPPKCVFCLEACPFTDNTCDTTTLARQRFEDPAIIQHEAVGFYLKSYVGYSQQYRASGASGGMLTWVLEKLLTEGHVDAVVTVARSNDDMTGVDNLFHLREMTTPEEIRSAAGSFYYPISVGEEIRHIQELKGRKRYAVVGLPCTLRGIALAMNRVPSLKKGIRFMLGLVCGHLPNYYYTEYLACLSGIEPMDLKCVNYRGKNPAGPANNYLFQAHSSKSTGRPLPFIGKVGAAYMNRLFQLNACNFCDDLFAEVADAVFMDAWLPEYISDSKGHSIVTVRNSFIKKMIETGIESEECLLHEIEVDKVARSQEVQWRGKSVRLRAQLALASNTSKKVPVVRQTPNRWSYRQMYFEIIAENWMQNASKEVWLSSGRDISVFNRKLRLGFLALKCISVMNRAIRIIRNPVRLKNKFMPKSKI